MLTWHIVDLVLDLAELQYFILNILQSFHLVADIMAVTVRKHTEEYALECETFGPLFADWRGQFHFEVFELVHQMVDFLLDQVLLLGALRIRHSTCFTLHVVEILEELLYLWHLKVVKANCPDQPVEVLFELEILPRDNKAVKGAWLHIRQSLAHLDLLLHPIPVPQIQKFDHQLNFSVHLYLLQVVLYLSWFLVLQRAWI